MRFLVTWGVDPDPDVAEYMGRKVPLVTDLATNEDDRRALELIVSGVAMGRPLVAPPGVPAERVAVLRQAFDKALKDPEFIAEAEKLKLDINPLSGERLQKVATETVNAPEKVVARARELIKPGKIEKAPASE